MALTFDLSKIEPSSHGGVRNWIIQGKHLGMAINEIKKDNDHPFHKHPQETIVYILEGKVEAVLGEGESQQKTILTKGMVQVCPANMLHGMKILEDVKLIEVVAPVPKLPASGPLRPIIATE